MVAPIVSICIPTFNRSRYVASLLESLVGQLEGFPYPYEIFIADNASPDATAEVVASFSDRLPIRYHRHAENIGGFPNWQFVMTQAVGRYLVYLSDDDSLLGDQVAAVIAKMEADPELVTVYAPWLLYDLVAQQQQGQFYSVPHDLRIERGAHTELLDHVLRHHIFPEVQITRREALQRIIPRINENAFFAFVHAADYLTQGAVLIQQEPFYVAITNYFADESREQLGNQEVEVAWDRYRGGLEYMLARAGSRVGPEERVGLLARIQQMIALRMSVAIRLREHAQRDPIDTYMLSMRLSGMGYGHLCPVPMQQVALKALLHMLLNDVELNRGIDLLLVVGEFEPALRLYLAENSPRRVEFSPELPVLDTLSNTLLFVSRGSEVALPTEFPLHKQVRLVREEALLQRFGL